MVLFVDSFGRRKTKKYISRWIGLVSIVISVYVFFNTDASTGYGAYFIVPFLFGILLFLFPILNLLNFSSLGPFLLACTMIIKYCISPLISCLGGYYSWLGVTPSKQNIESAVWITLYEMLTLYFVCYLCERHYKKKKYIVEDDVQLMKRSWIHYFLIIVGFGSFLVVPNAFSDYRFIFNSTNLTNNVFITASGAGVFRTFFILARYSLEILIINYLYKRNEKVPNIIYSLLAFAVVLLNSIYVSNLSRIQILVPLIIGMTLCMTFFHRKKERRAIVLAAILIGGSFVVLLSFLKFFGEGRGDVLNASSFKWWGDTLNMYFSGIKETAIGFKSTSYVNLAFGWNRLPLIFNDLFSGVSLLSNLSDISHTSTILYNYVYFGSTVSTGQIPPNIIEGVYYFGVVLSPIVPAFFTWLAYRLSYLARMKKMLDIKFVYYYATVWAGLILMINFNMIVANIINVALFYLVFVLIGKKFKFKR